MRAAVVLALIAGLAGTARADDELARARKLEAQLEYDKALAVVDAALARGGSDRARVVELHLLAGRLSAGLERTRAAEDHFAIVLALRPDTLLPDGTSPKLTAPFAAARARTSPLDIRVTTVRGVVTVLPVRDAPRIVRGISLRVSDPTGQWRELVDRNALRLAIPAGMTATDVAALDAAGNQLWTGKPAPENSGSSNSGASTSGTPNSGSSPSGGPNSGSSGGSSPSGGPNSGSSGGSSPSGSPNSGSPTSGSPNSGSPNSGAPNSGSPNSGSPNSGSPNSGSPNGAASGGSPNGSTTRDIVDRPAFHARWSTWAAVTGVALATGGIAAWRFQVAQRLWDDARSQMPPPDYSRLTALEDRGRRWGIAANIAFGAAAVSGVATFVLWLRRPGEPRIIAAPGPGPSVTALVRF